jgi:hypothetical protein
MTKHQCQNQPQFDHSFLTVVNRRSEAQRVEFDSVQRYSWVQHVVVRNSSCHNYEFNNAKVRVVRTWDRNFLLPG